VQDISPAKLDEAIGPLLKERGVGRAYLFGSHARGEAKSDSDIDILISLNKPIGLFAFVRLEREASDILGAKVDLVTEEFLSPYIRQEVNSEKKLIYA